MEDVPVTSWIDTAFAESEQLTAAVSASTLMHVAFGDRAGCKVRRIGRGFGFILSRRIIVNSVRMILISALEGTSIARVPSPADQTHRSESAKPEKIWETATVDIPVLEDDLLQILKTRFGTDDTSVDE